MTLFVVFVPLWLLGIIFPPTVRSDNMSLVQFVSLMWLPVIGVLVGRGRFLFGALFRERLSLVALASASMSAITTSALLSEDPVRSLGFVATAGLGLVCCAGIWEIVGSRMPGCLSIYASLGTALAAYLYSVGTRVQGRLTIEQAHPNYLGLVSFGILMSALAVRPRILGAVLITVDLFIIVETQSRSALAAGLLGLLAYASLKANQIRRRRAALALAGVFLACAVLLLMYYDATQNWVSSLFFLNDKYRGIGTGFTNRVAAWQEALDLFRDNPMFGVGFRMHERYMTILSSAHNGYLSILAEVGVVGALPLFTLTTLLCWRLLRQAVAGDEVSILGLSFVTGYLVIAGFERIFLNMGNPTSVLAWLFLLIPSRTKSTPLVSAHLRVAQLRTEKAWVTRNRRLSDFPIA